MLSHIYYFPFILSERYKIVSTPNITPQTIGSTNFVQISLQPNMNSQRFLHIHKNEPGILKEINYVFTTKNINIAAEYLQTDPDIGYVIIDTDSNPGSSILQELKAIRDTIRVRMLY